MSGGFILLCSADIIQELVEHLLPSLTVKEIKKSRGALQLQNITVVVDSIKS
jgi:hypothetical protein